MTHSMGKQKIGWIGLGKMGAPMALNLVKAGFPVTVYNRGAGKAEKLANAGAATAASIAELAAGSDIVISMVSDDPALEAVAAQVLGSAAPGTIYADMTTVSPAASARVAQAAAARRIAYVRAPVSGSTGFAAEATLIILTSGPREACETCAGAFAAMSRKVVYMGDAEQARHMKLVLNMMVGITAAMVGEALCFGERGGLDWATMIEVVGDSPLASPLVKYKTKMLVDRDFTPAFTAAQMAKDFDLILATAADASLPSPITAQVRQLWTAMMANGKGEQDMFACVTMLEEMAGIEPPPSG